MRSVDDQGLDTELARLLHRGERVDLPTLQAILTQARLARSRGPTLARMLVGRGLISEAEAAQLLAALGNERMSSSLIGSGEQMRPQPQQQQQQQQRLVASMASFAGTPPQQDARGASSADLVRPASGEHGAADAWRVGSVVDRYRIIERIGAGGMGVVYIAEHTGTGVRYALKTLRAGAEDDERERFRREGESQARVDGHRSVVRVHTMGETAGRQYLVMDLAAGGDLEQRVKTGKLPLEEVATTIAQVARGLAHMHARGVLHRDLKPANILFDDEGAPRLVDFGLARVEGASRLTRTGDVVGTPAYMAPEQALGHRERLGPWTDVFALGGCMYFALTGEVPFAGSTSIEVMTKVVDDDPRPPRSVRPAVPPELEAVCLNALTKDPEQRPTADEVAAALELFASRAAAAKTGPPPPPSRLMPALIGLALVSVLGLGLAVVTVRASKEDPAVAPVVTERTAGPRPTPGPTPPPPPPPLPPPPPPPPAPARPTVWTWREGESRSVELTVDGEMTGQMTRLMGGNYEHSRRFRFLWTATEATPERLAIRARLDELAVRVKLGEWNVDYDSRRPSQKDALGAALGGTFDVVFDPRTGGVASVTSIEQLQSKIDDEARPRERRMRSVPEFTANGMSEALRSLTAVLPQALEADDDDWTLKRDPPTTMQGLTGFGVNGHAKARRSDGALAGVTWGGLKKSAVAAAIAARMGGDPNQDVETTRTIDGEARLRDGSLVTSRLTETWEGLFTAHTTSVLTVTPAGDGAGGTGGR